MNLRTILQHAAGNDGAQAGGGDGAGAAANAPWFPEEHKAFVETKGWKTPADALTSYVNLEKLIGADKAGRTVVLPKDEKDAEGLKAFRTKLGVPEAADKYELPLPEGDSGDFAKLAATWMFDAGVPKTAAQAIAKNWNEYFTGLLKQEEAAAQAESTKQLDTLKGKWGQEFDKRSEFARRFLRASGWNEEKVNLYEKTFGTAQMLEDFYNWGSKTAEPDFAGGEGGGFSMSASTAKAKLDDIRMRRAKGEINDLQWKNTYQAEFEKLSEIVAKGS